MEFISIVVPCYNEERALPRFYDEIVRTEKQMQEGRELEFELVFIDDGSSDGTLDYLKSLKEKDGRVGYISFSRNFGKEAAIYAGLEKSSGDYIAVMDADLQDPPELLEDMYNAITAEGCDCAAARRTNRRGEPPIRSFFAKNFYKLIKKISNTEIADGARDYRLMKRCVVNAILSMKEYNRFSKGIFGWVGFNTKWIEYENTERIAGSTKWSFYKLLLYSIDGILAFSTMPLSIAALVGILFCFAAFVMILVIIAKTLLWGDPVAGYPSTLCVMFLIAGVQMFSIGIVGQYIAKMYMEIKNRPKYIVKEEG